MSYRRTLLLAPLAAIVAAVVLIVPSGAAAPPTKPRLTQVVLFPAFHLTRLRVTVHNQKVDPACPRSGSFEDWFQNPQSGGRFSQVCRDELMTLRYNANPRISMPRRFSDQPGARLVWVSRYCTYSGPLEWPTRRNNYIHGFTPVAGNFPGQGSLYSIIGFVKFRAPRNFPYVDVTAEKGSGIATVVGAVLPSFKVGQLVKASALLERSGDINQEDITNNAVRAWKAMPCYRFTLTDNPRVNHFALPVNRKVLARLVADLRRPRSHCGQ